MRSAARWALLLLLYGPSQAQEAPNFSLLFHGTASVCQGFLGQGSPAPGGGLWFGIRLNDRLDGLWGADYYTLPSQPITLLQPSPSHPVSFFAAQPSDDFALSVNVRWYLDEPRDRLRQKLDRAAYLVGGLGMDLVIDQPDPPPSPEPPPAAFFYNKSYDALFGLNLGFGMDFPLGAQWILYGEAMDHFIAWQGSTQIYSLRLGLKVLLDSAHLDPFR